MSTLQILSNGTPPGQMPAWGMERLFSIIERVDSLSLCIFYGVIMKKEDGSILRIY